MQDEQKDDVVEESSPQDEQVEESSTSEETQPSEATEEQAVEEQPRTVPYERFQEVIQEKNEARQQMAELISKFQQPNAPVPTQQEADIIQKYGAQDPATREFLRELKAEMRKEAQSVGRELAAPIVRENEALRRSVAQLQEKDFRLSNEDVKPGSPEENEIAQYVAMGMPYNKAAMAVMGPKRIEGAQFKGKVAKTTNNKTKVQATQERSSIPQTTGLPQNSSLSFKEKLDRAMRENGM